MAKTIQITPALNKKESKKFLKKMKETEKRKPTKQEKKFAEDIKKNFGEQNIILTIKKGTDPVKVGELIDTLTELDIVVKIRGDIVIAENKPKKHERRKE